MGIPMTIGTGMFKLLNKYPFIKAARLKIFRLVIFSSSITIVQFLQIVLVDMTVFVHVKGLLYAKSH